MRLELVTKKSLRALVLPWLKSGGLRLIIGLAVVSAAALGIALAIGDLTGGAHRNSRESPSPSKRTTGPLQLTPAQLANLKIQPVERHSFHSELVTEGKIAVDEDHSTPIFSPYAGRVMKLFVKPGDTVAVGEPLFTVQATDMVQAQNDFIAAATGLNKARSALNLAQIVDRRQRLLYEGKAVPLKEVQNARAALDAAENDVRSAEVALEAARNRLRILSKTEQEIDDFQQKGTIDPTTLIHAPIAGTVVQRKVGPGQFVGAGASDPVFVIGDLSTVWVVAYIRESEAAAVRVGQAVTFTVIGYPTRALRTRLTYVAASLDPATRRLPVRAEIANPGELLRPEMFASVAISTSDDTISLPLPSEAIVYEGNTARIWVATSETSLELRNIKTGVANGKVVQVLDGVQIGERVVIRGGVFIDRMPTDDGTSRLDAGNSRQTRAD
jgi:cobalt-zinc-cadmium efflux system membrane fusion protein